MPHPIRFNPYRLILALFLLSIGFAIAIYGYLVSNGSELPGWLPHLRSDAGLPMVFFGAITVAFGIGQLHLVILQLRGKQPRRTSRGLDHTPGKPY